MNSPVIIEEEHCELLKAQIKFSIANLQREQDYHRRRLKTITLAVESMEGELALMTRDWAKLPPEIRPAFEKANGKD